MYLDSDSSAKMSGKRKLSDMDTDQAGLGMQIKQLRSELKKMERLRERVAEAEEQNSLMRAELKRFHTSPPELKKRNEERVMSLLRLIRSFNGGDVEKMRSIIATVTSTKCCILTPSLFQELRGQNAVIQFFCIMLETFPDGIFEMSETELDESGVVMTKFAFTGTKISPLPSDMLYEKWKDLSLEEIFKKRAAVTGRFSGNAALQDTFFTLRSAPTAPGGHANAIEAARLSHEGISNSILEDMLPPITPILDSVKSIESVESETSVGDDQRKNHSSTTPSKNGKKIKISGHIVITYDASTERMNKIVFVWNTTSLLGQIFGFSDGDLEVLNGVVNSTQSNRV